MGTIANIRYLQSLGSVPNRRLFGCYSLLEGVIAMTFDFRRKLVDEYGEIGEEAASDYVQELAQLFAESPEGEALQEQGIEPGHRLMSFLDYELRYVGASPAEMDASAVRETLDVFAEKVTGRPEDLDQLIPELEAFCTFVQRAFDHTRAATWKREVQRQADHFRRAVRDPRHWGMAKSMMMQGLARGHDLSTVEDINQWMLTLQTEQLARLEAGRPAPGILGPVVGRMRQMLGLSASGPAPSEGEPEDAPVILELGGAHPSDPFELGSASGSRRDKSKEKARKKQRQANRRRNRR